MSHRRLSRRWQALTSWCWRATTTRNGLLSGPYPYYLKQRILGARGHLSNAAAGAFARRLAEGGTRQFVLAHLSRENNTPERARQTLERALAGLDAAVTVAPRSELSGPYTAEVYVCSE